VDVGFEQWHSDGTEMLNDTPPPASGNVCLGTWEKIGPQTYTLVHPAFNAEGNLHRRFGKLSSAEGHARWNHHDCGRERNLVTDRRTK
jgi:hypothetical protein